MPSKDKSIRFINNVWHGINYRTINGIHFETGRKSRSNRLYITKGIEVRFTRNEFRMWCLKRLRRIRAIYATGKIPSVDRINPLGHYELHNLRIIPSHINCKGGGIGVARNKAKEFEQLAPRYCATCGEKLRRLKFKGAGKLESMKPFLARKTCSQSCAAVIRNQKRGATWTKQQSRS